MVVVGCVILPHGAMTFDGNPNVADNTPTAERVKTISSTQRQDCGVLFTSCFKAAEIVKSTSPDVIFLNTPHGICLSDALGVYLNPRAKGTAEWNNQWSEFEVDVELDSNLASKFLEHLQSDGIAAEGITAFSKCEMPLRWGEVIPMWFLQDLMLAGERRVKVVIFSNPVNKRRAPTPFSSVVNVGRSIAKFLKGLDQRILYVVSGDLAHTHKTNCQDQLYLPDPRWSSAISPTALPFDLSVENWIKGVPFIEKDISEPVKSTEMHITQWNATVAKDAEQWLSKATDLKSSALSCGIFGFGVLHGLLLVEIEQGTGFTAHFLCRLAPTYYGMMVAAFVKEI